MLVGPVRVRPRPPAPPAERSRAPSAGARGVMGTPRRATFPRRVVDPLDHIELPVLGHPNQLRRDKPAPVSTKSLEHASPRREHDSICPEIR